MATSVRIVGLGGSRALGEEVARAAGQFKTEGKCDYAEDNPQWPRTGATRA